MMKNNFTQNITLPDIAYDQLAVLHLLYRVVNTLATDVVEVQLVLLINLL